MSAVLITKQEQLRPGAKVTLIYEDKERAGTVLADGITIHALGMKWTMDQCRRQGIVVQQEE